MSVYIVIYFQSVSVHLKEILSLAVTFFSSFPQRKMYKNWMRKKLKKSGRVESMLKVTVQRCVLSLKNGCGQRGHLTVDVTCHWMLIAILCSLSVAISPGMTFLFVCVFGVWMWLAQILKALGMSPNPQVTLKVYSWKPAPAKQSSSWTRFHTRAEFSLNICQECSENAVSLRSALTHSCHWAGGQVLSRNGVEVPWGFFPSCVPSSHTPTNREAGASWLHVNDNLCPPSSFLRLEINFCLWLNQAKNSARTSETDY